MRGFMIITLLLLLTACGGGGSNVRPPAVESNVPVNVYGTDTFVDEGVCIQYRFGWGEVGQRDDRMYRTFCKDSKLTTVFDSATLAAGMKHVGDPSIIRKADGSWIMFYTACKAPCAESAGVNENEVWSTVSTDKGFTWTDHRVFISNGRGAAEPSAVKVSEGDYRVFYTNRLDPSTIYMAYTNDLRVPIGGAKEFRATLGGAVSGVDVGRHISGKWVMCANVHRGSGTSYRLDIDCTESEDLEDWRGSWFIRATTPNVKGKACSATTPDLGLLSVDGTVIFTESTRLEDGTCPLTNHKVINSFRY